MSLWREYHEATKHTVEKLMASRHSLDWANMPDPFRHYEGVPVLDLPADAPAQQAGMLDVLMGAPGESGSTNGAELLSQVLFHAASISATKLVPSSGNTYALRVNPSSGNLHPTEFHFATRGLAGWPDGLYHYRVASHMAEQRATGDYTQGMGVVVFYLTSIAWREAWKYQTRAYRYCLHDIGHATESLILSLRAAGFDAKPNPDFDDDQLSRLLGLAGELPHQLPMMIVTVDGIPALPSPPAPRQFAGGTPNQLSRTQLDYPLIDRIHTATKHRTTQGYQPPSAPLASIPANRLGRPFADTVRTRRSALDFVGGEKTISRQQFETLLSAAQRTRDFITLYLYVHRVDHVAPGVYRYRDGELQLLKPGDHRVAAAGLSLSQNLAGNSVVTFSMVADLERSTALHGDRGYRYCFFEAGITGQRLYLASEAMGFQSTGIGAFYDDSVHHYLGLTPEQGQVIYHFACGYAVRDNRISVT